MLTEHLLYARCHALFFILLAKQKVDVCISILQMETLKLLDDQSFADSQKNQNSKCRSVNSQTTLSLHHQILFSKCTYFSVPEYLSTNVSMSACEHAPMQTKHRDCN